MSAIAWPPATHRDDPATAHAAARAVTRSGQRKRHADLVVACVEDAPGLSAVAVGERTGLGHIEAQRRLSDLQNKGMVRQGQRVSVQGRRDMVSWWPVAEQGALGL